MHLTTKSEYSLLALMYLARHDDGYQHAVDISTYAGVSKKYLEQLLTLLRRNRLVRAKRGTNGGYQLARPATAITIAEVVRLMDGPLAPTDSVSRFFYAKTPLSRERGALRVFRDIRNYIARRLERQTIADLIH